MPTRVYVTETVINAATGATAIPADVTEGYMADEPRVRTHITYGGTVTAAEVRLLTRNPRTGKWGRGLSTSTTPLVPGATPESRDWDVGVNQEFAFQVVTLTGTTPTITVDVHGVEV